MSELKFIEENRKAILKIANMIGIDHNVFDFTFSKEEIGIKLVEVPYQETKQYFENKKKEVINSE